MAGTRRKKISRGKKEFTPAEEDSAKEVSEIKWLKRLVIAFLGFLALVIFSAAAFIYFYFKGTSADVKVEINGPEEVFRGVPFKIDVNVANDSDRLLSQAEITVILPENIKLLGNPQSNDRLIDEVGDMGSGSLTKKTYQFLALGDVLNAAEISFKFSYLGGGRSRFEVSRNHKVKVKAAPIELAVKKPDQIMPGSAFEMEINYKNISDFDFPEAVLELQYPPAFKFASASLTPDSLTNFWRLGEVRAGSEGKLTVRGTLQSSGSASTTMAIAFSAVFFGESYPVAEANIDLSLAPPPVETKILINKREDYVPRLGDRLNYTIQYKNLSGTALADAVIEVELAGDMFDFASVATFGNWDIISRKITWNAANNQNLRLVDAGGAGEVNFSINLKNSFPITRLNDKNFVLKATVKFTSPSVPYYLTADSTKVVNSLETKVAGLVVVDAQVFYRDAESGIINSGQLPPKVGMPTQYSVHWLIRNYSTDIKDVLVRAPLPQGVRWTGVVKSNADTAPLYDEATNEVRWAIDKIRATKGILDSPLEAVFQIEATPSAADVGRYEDLIGDTSLRAVDDFTGAELTSFDVAINSSLPDDITIGQNGGKVIP